MQLFYYYAVRDLCPSSASSQIQGISVGISADLEKDKVESRCPLLEPQNNCLMVKKGDRFTLIPRPEEKWIYVQRVDDSTTVDKDSNATDPSSVSINTCSCDSGNLEHCDRSLLCDNEFERGFVSLDCLDIIEVSHNLTKNETFPKEEYLGNLEVKGDKMDVDDIVQKVRLCL